MMAVFNPKEREEAIYALAASWASIDGKLEKFAEGKDAKSLEEAFGKFGGYMEGYLEEAGEMLARLERRGFTLTRFVNPVRPA